MNQVIIRAAEEASGWALNWDAVAAIATAIATGFALLLPYFDRRRVRNLAGKIAGTVVAAEFRHAANTAEKALQAVRKRRGDHSKPDGPFVILPKELDVEPVADLAAITLPVFQANQTLLLSANPTTVAKIFDAHAEIERQLRRFREAYEDYRAAGEPDRGRLAHITHNPAVFKAAMQDMDEASSMTMTMARNACVLARGLAKLGFPDEWKPNAPDIRDDA